MNRKKSRFTEHQMIGILKEADSGIKVQEVCRKYGISNAAFYQWKAKFGGMAASDIKRLRDLEGELSQYKKMYAELAHENYAIKGCYCKKAISITERREVADTLINDYDFSVMRASRAASVSRSSLYCRPSAERCDAEVKTKLNHLMEKRPRWGFWKFFYWLRRQGYGWNHKKVWRIYCAMNLNLPRRKKRVYLIRERCPLAVIPMPNQSWALDFMHDALGRN